MFLATDVMDAPNLALKTQTELIPYMGEVAIA